MSVPHSPRDATRARVTLRLQDLSLADRDTVYPAPHGGDWVLLALLVVVLLGNGLYVWHQRGLQDEIGRAVFFGLLLFCLYWSAVVYTFKLSFGVHVGPHGLALVRGPWRTELAWSEIGRLVERVEPEGGRRYRWVVAMAYDGRQLQLREDLVANYQEFRIEVYERYRLWQDHGGTWGTNGGGPFLASDHTGGEVSWWLAGASIFLLPALYFLILLPAALLAGLTLLTLAIFCAGMALRAVLRRQRYTVEPKFIESRRPLQPPIRLGWREVTRIERARHAASWLMSLGISLGRLALAIAARSDGRTESFPWSPRVPEYLILRGGGRQVRVRLHRLARPDELLAWVEFYERIARAAGGAERPARASMPIQPRAMPELLPTDLSSPTGPADPWGSGRGGHPEGDAPPSGTQPPLGGISQPAANGARSFPTAPSRPGTPSRPLNASRPLAQRVPGYAPMPAPPSDATRGRMPIGQEGDDAWLRETRHNPRAGTSSPGARPAASGGLPNAAMSGSVPPPSSYGPPPAPGERLSHPPAYVPTSPQGPMVPGTYPGEWDIPDESPADVEAQPTDAMDGLAESFAAWQDESQQPPQLPRFGPPPTTRPGE